MDLSSKYAVQSSIIICGDRGHRVLQVLSAAFFGLLVVWLLRKGHGGSPSCGWFHHDISESSIRSRECSSPVRCNTSIGSSSEVYQAMRHVSRYVRSSCKASRKRTLTHHMAAVLHLDMVYDCIDAQNMSRECYAQGTGFWITDTTLMTAAPCGLLCRRGDWSQMAVQMSDRQARISRTEFQ